MPQLSEKDLRRFWDYVDKRGAAECWLWRGPNTGYSRPGLTYGRLYVQRVNHKAHRLAYYIQHGEDPGQRLVNHTCDTPLCVNGSHLYAGDHKSNRADAMNRDRWQAATGDRHSSRTRPEARPRGEKHNSAKLTEHDVLRIRELYATGKYKQKELARMFGVWQGTVGDIVVRRTWKHL